MSGKTIYPEAVQRATQHMVDQGKLIEAGWVGYRMMVLPRDAPDIQISECRLAFFAGAQHVFASMLAMLEPDEEVTDADLARVEMIDMELREFLKVFKLDNSSALRR